MRILIFLLALICLGSPPVFCADGTSFDDFVASRDVVATLYFQPNSEGLLKGERERISAAIAKLRKLQNNGRMIRVEGFSSSDGDQEENFRLSFFRARTVADLIEAKGLPAEVSLTGYGDLRATSQDAAKERRVEIASYIKPVVMKRIKVAEGDKTFKPVSEESAQFVPEDKDIDSYRVDQAIRKKIGDKHGDVADQLDDKTRPGLSQSKESVQKDVLDRGYTQWRISVDPEHARKLSQLQKAAEADLQRGYTWWQKASKTKDSPDVTTVAPAKAPSVDVTMIAPDQTPIIDVLTIEQAIADKIDAKLPAPSGAVSQVGVNY